MVRGGIDNRFAIREPHDDPDEVLKYNTYTVLSENKVYKLKTTAPDETIKDNARFYNGLHHSDLNDFVELLIDEGFEAEIELIQTIDFKI